jgi:hypothetical protein
MSRIMAVSARVCTNSQLRALLLVLVVLGALWPRAKVQDLLTYDQPFYIGIADDIVRHGRFTDGEFGGPAHAPGMRFAPLYPMLLAGFAAADPRLARSFDCVAAKRVCGDGAWGVRTLQFGMLAGSYWLIWDIAVVLDLGAGLAFAALGIALLTAPLLLQSVNYLMTEIPSLVLSTSFAACLVRVVRGRGGWVVPAGLALGAAILVRPAFLYLGYGLVLVGFWRVALTAGIVILPWIVRNEIVLGRGQLTFGYAGHTLAQRIAFDSMTWRDYAWSFVCWLPDGNGIGGTACRRFGWNDLPDTFYAIGMREMVPLTLRAAGGVGNHLHWLVTHELARDPMWHLATTLPLALRGVWVDHYWGLVLAPACAWMLWRRERGFLALALPALFMLGFNACFAVNQVRYNLMLIPPLSVAGAAAAARIWSAIRARAIAT